ncbi:TonB family protein [Lewinella lacunae]|uniref:TonB family protein n=2 Tax=Neolewinella lacunae TaxID=1517758 RepID=A0A923PIW9_9BACT|nr:TonB family protein [Neolewinella lacunae]
MLFGGLREVMPLFPGCDEIAADYPSQKKCADSLMRTFIYGNLRYPYVAWRDSVEGTAVVSFTVEKDGSITGIEVVRDPGAGTGTEALRLVNLMTTKEKRWTPGRQAGKLVRVRFNLPVRFKLTEGTVPYPPPPAPPENKGSSDVFKVVEEMPRFPACEDIPDEAELENCAKVKLLEYLHENLNLTPIQLASCAAGLVVIQFVVEKDGTITDAKIMRDIGVGYGQSALEVVQSMNDNGIRWIPGKQGSQPVRVEYNLPVKFRLE